jgi:hypothetical protein
MSVMTSRRAALRKKAAAAALAAKEPEAEQKPAPKKVEKKGW